jgi:ribosomal-protein-alanine N-acetyltransferase
MSDAIISGALLELLTERLILRSLHASDVEAVARIWADPDVTRYMGGPRDFEQVRASLEQDAQADPAPQFDLWPVIEKATGDIIGHCGLLDKMVDDQMEFELVYVLAASAWGKGYATEVATALKHYAFERLGLDRIVALIDLENEASERVAVKVNMRYKKDTLRPSGKTLRVYAIHRNPDEVVDATLGD